MNFIELCLTGGIITAKERTVLMNKARSLGLTIDAFEVILDAMMQQKGLTYTQHEPLSVGKGIKKWVVSQIPDTSFTSSSDYN